MPGGIGGGGKSVEDELVNGFPPVGGAGSDSENSGLKDAEALEDVVIVVPGG